MYPVDLMQLVIGTVDLFSLRHGLFHVCIEDFEAGFACTWVYTNILIANGKFSSAFALTC